MRHLPAIAFVAAAMLTAPAAGQGTDDAPLDVLDPDFAGRVFDSPIPARKGDPLAAGDEDAAQQDAGQSDAPDRDEATGPGPAGTEAGRTAIADEPSSDGEDTPTLETGPLPVVLRPGMPPDTDLGAGGRIKSVPDPDAAGGDGEEGRFIRAPDRTYETETDGALGAPIDSPQTALRKGARLRQLDKMTGTIVTFEMVVGETRDVARLRVKLDACRAPEDNDTHGTMAFLHIWDKKSAETEPAFTGWMFAESPALSALDHPRYDLWVINCTTVSGETSAASE